MNKSGKKVCAILGVGPGNGLSFARKFSEHGYAVALCSRNGDKMSEYAEDIDNARGYACDVADMNSDRNCVDAIGNEIGGVDTLIFNAGSANWGTIDQLDDENFAKGFDVNASGLFRAVQCVLPEMRQNKSGNIVVVGAGAALRGRPGTIAFAAAKAAQRSIAQSLARQLGPENIHVSYVVLDGAIDLETTMERMSDKPKEFFLSSDGVADAAYTLVKQDRQAWTFELDLRTFGESW
jgi:NAD(P)-dependent dehydrogenase (short-subunit alcohol dehydrogenase family)